MKPIDPGKTFARKESDALPIDNGSGVLKALPKVVSCSQLHYDDNQCLVAVRDDGAVFELIFGCDPDGNAWDWDKEWTELPPVPGTERERVERASGGEVPR